MTALKVRLSLIFTFVFRKPYVLIKNQKYLRYVFKGGRNSGKSFHIAMFIILLIMKHPITFLVIRKVGNTLETSVFEQMQEAIDILKVDDKFHIKKNPMQIIYKPRGNKILFRGADKPRKIKSIKVAKYPIAGLWVEEAAEFLLESEISMIEKSVLRSKLPNGLKYILILSYNPPKRKSSWLNKAYGGSQVPRNTYVHHSTYKDNPHLSKDTLDEAEITKEMNERTYRHEWLGEAIGSGVAPFENLTFREISDEEHAAFDNIRQGVDFGYANDPLAFVRWHYDKKRRKIYAMDEFYGVKISNREFAQRILKNGFESNMTIADSAEPKSINEIKKEHNIRRIKGAKKGPDSVEYGERWLDDLTEIVIDPRRTPNIASEFENIDYEVDAHGNVKTRLSDENNHSIDASRYAFEDDMTKKASVGILK